MVKVIFIDVLGVLDLHGRPNTALIDLMLLAKRQIGLRVIITTNTSLDRGNDPLGLTKVSDQIVNSTSQYPKPSPEFWSLCLSIADNYFDDLVRDQILVVDDNEDICLSAASFGFQSLVYQPDVSDQKIKDLLFDYPVV